MSVQARAQSRVLYEPAAAPAVAHQHFRHKLAVETDASDVYADQQAHIGGFVVVDARSRQAFADRHIPGAISLPHAEIETPAVTSLPRDKVIVTYCWGPYCNAAAKAAMKLAALGFQVKEMIGGLEGWVKERYPLEGDKA